MQNKYCQYEESKIFPLKMNISSLEFTSTRVKQKQKAIQKIHT